MVDHVLTDNEVKREYFREVGSSILDLPAISTILIVLGTQSLPVLSACVESFIWLRENCCWTIFPGLDRVAFIGG